MNKQFSEACKNGHLDVVCRLLEDPRVDPSAKDNYAIRWASAEGNLDVVYRLLEDERVDPAAVDNMAICWASYCGHSDVVSRLLEDERVDPSDKDNYAIRYASEKGYLDVVLLLMEHLDPIPRSVINPEVIKEIIYRSKILKRLKLPFDIRMHVAKFLWYGKNPYVRYRLSLELRPI